MAWCGVLWLQVSHSRLKYLGCRLGRTPTPPTRPTHPPVLQIRVDTKRMKSGSKGYQSAVMPSLEVTARSATTCECVRWSPCTPAEGGGGAGRGGAGGGSARLVRNRASLGGTPRRQRPDSDDSRGNPGHTAGPLRLGGEAYPRSARAGRRQRPARSCHRVPTP